MWVASTTFVAAASPRGGGTGTARTWTFCGSRGVLHSTEKEGKTWMTIFGWILLALTMIQTVRFHMYRKGVRKGGSEV